MLHVTAYDIVDFLIAFRTKLTLCLWHVEGILQHATSTNSLVELQNVVVDYVCADHLEVHVNVGLEYLDVSEIFLL